MKGFYSFSLFLFIIYKNICDLQLKVLIDPQNQVKSKT